MQRQKKKDAKSGPSYTSLIHYNFLNIFFMDFLICLAFKNVVDFIL